VVSRAIQIGYELLVIQQHALLPKPLWLKVWLCLLSYPYLGVPDDPVADDLHALNSYDQVLVNVRNAMN
jgi:hypothetical protein